MTTDASIGPVSTDKGAANPLAPGKKKVDLSKFIIEDNEPIESFYAEKQYRLLTHPLWASWSGPGPGRTFVVAANVGLFGAEDQLQALCPDVMLSIDVRLGDLDQRENRSYFVWERGKAPDVVIEIVSDRRGGEGDRKPAEYARIGVAHYVVFDPENRLRQGILRSFVLRGAAYELMTDNRYPAIGLGLVLWRDVFEESRGQWIRWCDLDGRLIPTAEENVLRERERANLLQERAEQEQKRAEQEQKRAEQEQKRAESEQKRAEEAVQRAEQADRERQFEREQTDRERQLEREARERLEAKLRALGIDPNA